MQKTLFVTAFGHQVTALTVIEYKYADGGVHYTVGVEFAGEKDGIEFYGDREVAHSISMEVNKYMRHPVELDFTEQGMQTPEYMSLEVSEGGIDNAVIGLEVDTDNSDVDSDGTRVTIYRLK